ncbi:MAG: hypothetical protein FWD31_12835 [Planctomycetaceae bacterium]|nr:hypothetical protein [Planctomycetaceae bacterium]
MKSISKTVKMILFVSTAFLAPWVYMTGGADIIAVKDRIFSGMSNPASGDNSSNASPAPQVSQAAPAQSGNRVEHAVEKPPVVITPQSIEHKDAVDLPLPDELQRLKSVPLADLLRFDYVPNDIVQRWPYVTAVNPELHVQAYRAPFYTGTTPEDLEGVVTYYFDARNNTTQIMIRAKTGDFRPLVDWLETWYGFRYRETQSPVVYVYEPPSRWPSKSDSHLWIRPAHAFADGYEYKRFDVTLVLNRPKE